VGLDAEVMDAASAVNPRRPAVEMDPLGTDLHEDVTRARDIHIEDDCASEIFFIEDEALFDVRCEQMDVVKVMHGLLL
jgi:hypothetical protein